MPAIAALVLSARRVRWPIAVLGVAAQLAIGACLCLYACVACGVGTGIDAL